MANPVSRIPSAQLPAISEEISGPSGTPTLTFHAFLAGLWARTGGASGVNSTDVQRSAAQALSTGQHATQSATAAQTSATNALSTANAALSTANTALTTANNTQGSALVKTQNLADLQSVAAARTNLGLSYETATFVFDTCPAGLHKAVPVLRTLLVPPNLAGTAVWFGVAPTSTAVFSVGTSRMPSVASNPIGVIQIGPAGITLSAPAGVTLSAGDCLIVTCPAAADASLAQLAITIPLYLA